MMPGTHGHAARVQNRRYIVGMHVVDIEADYVCYDVPNEFIVGFGLDYDEKYRNLPYVGVLKEEIYTK